MVQPDCSERKEDAMVKTPDQMPRSGGHGNARARIDRTGERVRWSVSYEKLSYNLVNPTLISYSPRDSAEEDGAAMPTAQWSTDGPNRKRATQVKPRCYALK